MSVMRVKKFRTKSDSYNVSVFKNGTSLDYIQMCFLKKDYNAFHQGKMLHCL